MRRQVEPQASRTTSIHAHQPKRKHTRTASASRRLEPSHTLTPVPRQVRKRKHVAAGQASSLLTYADVCYRRATPSTRGISGRGCEGRLGRRRHRIDLLRATYLGLDVEACFGKYIELHTGRRHRGGLQLLECIQACLGLGSG
jgi:hypothetical protein